MANSLHKVPRANPLFFVQMYTGKTYPYSPNTGEVLLPDWGKGGIWVNPFYQKFGYYEYAGGEQIIIQFLSDYTTNTLRIVSTTNNDDSTGGAAITLSTEYTNSNGVKYLKGVIDTYDDLDEGFYYAIITCSGGGSTIYYRSQPFEVSARFNDLPVMYWKDSQTSGIYYGTWSFGCRLENYYRPFLEVENDVYKGYTNSPINVSSKINKKIKISLVCPDYLCEIYASAMSHQTLIIDSIYYVLSEKLTITPNDNSSMCRFDAILEQVDYENYSQFIV